MVLGRGVVEGGRRGHVQALTISADIHTSRDPHMTAQLLLYVVIKAHVYVLILVYMCRHLAIGVEVADRCG